MGPFTWSAPGYRRRIQLDAILLLLSLAHPASRPFLEMSATHLPNVAPLFGVGGSYVVVAGRSYACAKSAAENRASSVTPNAWAALSWIASYGVRFAQILWRDGNEFSENRREVCSSSRLPQAHRQGAP